MQNSGATVCASDTKSPQKIDISLREMYSLKIGSIWRTIATESFAFWMCCAYFFFEYIRPQAIWSGFDAYPYWARTFIILAFFGWLLNPRRQIVWTKITTGVFAYLALIILSSYFAYWPEVSWSAFMVYFNWVVVFFVLTQVVTTRERFFIILLIFFLASFKLSLFGARSLILRGFTSWGIYGPEGFFQNPGELAVQMVVFAPLSLFFIYAIKEHLNTWQKFFLYLMPLTALMTVLGSNSRGSQVAMAIQGAMLILYMKRHRIKTVLIIIMFFIAAAYFLPVSQKERFHTAGKDGTSEQRLLYLKHGWQMIKDHPILGVGYFNFPRYYYLHHKDDLVRGSREHAQLPHNIFIQVGTDTGFLGLLIFIYLLFIAFVRTSRKIKEAKKRNDKFLEFICIGLNTSLVGYIIAGQFVTIAYYPYFWIHLFFIATIFKLESKSTCIENSLNNCKSQL
jgi:putative inorganic carbon (hco3(-)) transporter